MDTAAELKAKPSRGASAATEVYDALRRLIIGLSLVPGTVLSRADLAARFGVSQTPVRDALMRLEAEGLVHVYPQHATIVATIDMEMAKQSHFLRRSLELEIVSILAGRHDAALISELRKLLDRQASEMRSGNLTEFTSVDELMHARFYEAAGVPDLLALVRSRAGHIDRLRRLHLMTPGKAQRILDEHGSIVDAIAAGDPDRARAALRRHLSGTLAEAPEILAQFPSYFTAGSTPN